MTSKKIRELFEELITATNQQALYWEKLEDRINKIHDAFFAPVDGYYLIVEKHAFFVQNLRREYIYNISAVINPLHDALYAVIEAHGIWDTNSLANEIIDYLQEKGRI